MILKKFSLLVASLLLAGAAPALADPIDINLTSGSINYSRQNLAFFNAQGSSGWRIYSQFGLDESWYPDSAACFSTALA